ncbi:50S ribosomal protein L11 methyltransferase [Gilvimarinus agarilyticus]|uniref:50S ribosomal protein L11 methyltransferase n=1 Tax=unclassified Gilvimarinus TaxID=2642066 RepID=UPI001C088D01|nr:MULTISPECIES: 50S ribosomal protein L11 methyltransferase [unclassified Gilvimarinus]MBU2885663.1 50S ribosomal protein L11 methyltransferase [Gilvimarinus agarilyticus]MDO6570522.1 50S ribosomal protein L11 methyltransferase [Gilvimarinus sp. 2_MG-2023]MDO6747463.1 50S ribosomal protein L11 methyltransferase [Gilvimarinus sp. 1_MG-2023]
MPWLQLKLTANRADTAAIEDALMACGAVSVTLEDNADQPILEPALGETPLWDQVKITGLYEAGIDTQSTGRELQQQLGHSLSHLQWEQLEDKDWEREWMSNFHPICCGERLWICPSWCEPPEPDKINILLDPGLAFGTGTHPTTFLCMQWLDQQNLTDLELIDFGCGSGILGIAALKLGARHVVGVDIDPQALLATADNAERNGLADTAMPVYLPQKAPGNSADIVLANILAGPLAELASELTQLTRPGGKICLSGILNTQAQAVMDAYTEHFEFEPIAQKEEWVRLVGQKKQ